MDNDGKEVKKEDAFGCKVTHNILHPDMCLVMDEVGGKTNQKGDGNAGVQFQPCERGMMSQEKINTNDKHYTLLGLTALTGKTVMCIMIFSGIHPNEMVETGLDLMIETISNEIDDEFFEKKQWKRKEIYRLSHVKIQR